MADMVSDYYLRPGYHFGDEFDFGLGLILDALRRGAAPHSAKPSPPDPLLEDTTNTVAP